jgi:hypothetical protein
MGGRGIIKLQQGMAGTLNLMILSTGERIK